MKTQLEIKTARAVKHAREARKLYRELERAYKVAENKAVRAAHKQDGSKERERAAKEADRHEDKLFKMVCRIEKEMTLPGFGAAY